MQGIGLRYYTQDLAQKLDLVGFVRNEKDGSVLIEAEGEEESLKELIAWSHKGPSYIEVTDVKVEWSDELKGYKDFVIER